MMYYFYPLCLKIKKKNYVKVRCGSHSHSNIRILAIRHIIGLGIQNIPINIATYM